MGIIIAVSAHHYSGADADKASIPVAGKQVGDRYFATDTKIPYFWDGAGWVFVVPDNTISAAKLQVDSVETLKIKDRNVTTTKIALLGVTVAEIGPLAVTAAKLNTDAVETIKIKNLNVTSGKLDVLNKGRFENALLHIQDQKAAGTQGGTFTLGAWRTRDLNTVLTNEIPGASLASDQITLPAGDYFIIASAPCYFQDRNKVKLRDVDSPTDLLVGTSETEGVVTVQTRSFVTGQFTLGVERKLEIQHYSGSTRANQGFGVESNFGVVEVYTDVLIWKVD